MKSHLLLSLCVIVCVCFSDLSAQVQRPTKQKYPQTILRPAIPSKVDAFIKTLQGATTLEEVQKAFSGANLTKAEVDQVKNRIESSAALKQKLDQLQNVEVAAGKAMAKESSQAENARLTTLKNQINTERLDSYRKSILTIRQAAVAKRTDALVTCQADAPLITSVSPVTPAVEFAIQGRGFGDVAGTVEVVTAGKVFVAHVTGWNGCTIYAELGDNVAGVRANPQAVVSVTTREGKKTRTNVDFKPTLVTSQETKYDWVFGWYWGAKKDWTFWNFALKNDWYVASTSLTHYGQGHAEITSAPARNVPNGSARTKVHAGVAALGHSSFTVYLTLAGPKGLPYK